MDTQDKTDRPDDTPAIASGPQVLDKDRHIELLERSLALLEEEKLEGLRALDRAATLGVFATSYAELEGPEPILTQGAERARDMIRFQVVSFYLADEADFDFRPALDDPADSPAAAALHQEVDRLIADHSFSLALDQRRPVFFRSADGESDLLLHSLTTPSRVRGMFVGRMAEHRRDVSDTTEGLFTVVMLALAQALESLELYQRIAAANRELEAQVARRTGELAQSNLQLRTILESLPAGMALVDPETFEVKDANAALLDMLGQPREAVVGRRCTDSICPATPGDCPALKAGGHLSPSERVLRNSEGLEAPVLKSVVTVSLEGRPHLLESFVDISEQHKLARLREDVELITRHDLKGPLNGIISIPEFLLADPSLKQSQREWLEIIRDAGRRMLLMINSSLDLYKMETGTYVLRPAPVDLLNVLHAVERQNANYMEDADVGLDVAVDGAEPAPEATFFVTGDEMLLYSLVSNLVLNAIQASPRGERVHVLFTSGDPARMRIRNQGVVPDAVRDHFFEKFATHGKFKGTGLGTYTARLIAKTLGGKIAMRTALDEGTELSVFLPAAPPV
ncbi:MAG: ATP-binding protein [Desulfovibrionaceae bacterium]